MATATTTKTLKSFKLSCPSCGASDAIFLDLNDLGACSCSQCSDEFSPQQAKKKAAEQLRRWTALCDWIAMASTALDGASDDDESE